MDQQQLRTMIDACRPGGKDLHAPDMAALADHLERDPQAREIFDRSQRLDSALGAAFRDVPAPAGLEQRLLAAVGAAESASKRGQVERAPRAGGFSRRALAIAALAACLTTFGLMGAYWLFNTSREITQTLVVDSTQAVLVDQHFSDPAAWNSIKKTPPQTIPASIAAGPSAWRRIDTDLGQAVVFHIPVGRRQDAYLFVTDVKGPLVGIGAAPPRTPFPGGTGGWKIGTWSAGGFLYVLAIQGDSQDYSRLFHRRPTA